MPDSKKVLPVLRNKVKAVCKKNQRLIDEKGAEPAAKVLETVQAIITLAVEALPKADRVKVLVDTLRKVPR